MKSLVLTNSNGELGLNSILFDPRPNKIKEGLSSRRNKIYYIGAYLNTVYSRLLVVIKLEEHYLLLILLVSLNPAMMTVFPCRVARNIRYLDLQSNSTTKATSRLDVTVLHLVFQEGEGGMTNF